MREKVALKIKITICGLVLKGNSNTAFARLAPVIKHFMSVPATRFPKIMGILQENSQKVAKLPRYRRAKNR